MHPRTLCRCGEPAWPTPERHPSPRHPGRGVQRLHQGRTGPPIPCTLCPPGYGGRWGRRHTGRRPCEEETGTGGVRPQAEDSGVCREPPEASGGHSSADTWISDSGPRTSVVLNHRPGVLRYSDHRKLIHIQQTSPECVLWARHHKGSQESRVNQTQQSWPRAPRGASGPPVLRSCEETEPRAAEQRPTQPGPPHLPVCASHTGEGLGPPTSMARGPPAPFYQNKTGTRDGEVKGAPLVTLRKASRAAAA